LELGLGQLLVVISWCPFSLSLSLNFFFERLGEELRMSSQRGNTTKKGPPKYQNKVGFKHNPKSRLTAVILSLPNEGLCLHCHEKVEWKKKFRKYKRLTTKHRCTRCTEKSIVHAYHTLCQSCARTHQVCAWCQKPAEIVHPSKTKEEIKEEREREEAMLLQMSLRERRSYLRQKERAMQLAEGGLSPDSVDGDDDDSGEDSDDDDADDGDGDGDGDDTAAGPSDPADQVAGDHAKSDADPDHDVNDDDDDESESADDDE
jgi:hypothetical protein